MNPIPLSQETVAQISDDVLLTAEQVAQILQVKPQTVRDAAWRGKIPCVRLWEGRKKSLLRFKKGEIEEFIRQKSVPAKERQSTRKSRR